VNRYLGVAVVAAIGIIIIVLLDRTGASPGPISGVSVATILLSVIVGRKKRVEAASPNSK
jgi:hypothetical protein